MNRPTTPRRVSALLSPSSPKGTPRLTEEREEYLWNLGYEVAHRKWLERGRPEDPSHPVYDSETLFVNARYTGQKHEGQPQFWEELAAFQQGADAFFLTVRPIPRSNPRRRRNPVTREVLSDLTSVLDLLIAVRWSHLTAHWRSSGPNSFGDHLMYERLYKTVDGEIDALAEQLVQLGGSSAVDPSAMLSDAARRISKVEEHMRPDPQTRLASRALAIEVTLVGTLATVRQQLQQADALSLGLDNLLAGVADTHNSHIYLLKQRLSSGV
jgi:DNA-binding ferritin-like protein